MVYRPAMDPKFCFVLIPLHSPFIENYEHIIRAAAELTGLRAGLAGPIYETSPAVQQNWERIWRASVIIADVTGRDSEVVYLLGICNSLGVSVIVLTQCLEDVPADFRQRLCIQYQPEGMMWQENLFEALGEALRKVLAGDEIGEQLKWPYDTHPQK